MSTSLGTILSHNIIIVFVNIKIFSLLKQSYTFTYFYDIVFYFVISNKLDVVNNELMSLHECLISVYPWLLSPIACPPYTSLAHPS